MQNRWFFMTQLWQPHLTCSAFLCSYTQLVSWCFTKWNYSFIFLKLKKMKRNKLYINLSEFVFVLLTELVREWTLPEENLLLTSDFYWFPNKKKESSLYLTTPLPLYDSATSHTKHKRCMIQCTTWIEVFF